MNRQLDKKEMEVWIEMNLFWMKIGETDERARETARVNIEKFFNGEIYWPE